jgi:hypothetical protein
MRYLDYNKRLKNLLSSTHPILLTQSEGLTMNLQFYYILFANFIVVVIYVYFSFNNIFFDLLLYLRPISFTINCENSEKVMY